MELFMKHLHHRCQAVGRAGCIGNDIVFFRVIGIFIDAHDDGGIVIFAGSRNDNFLDCSSDMFAGTDLVLQLARGFNYDFNAISAPVQMFRISIMKT